MKHAVVIFETCSVYQCLDFKQQTTDVSGQMSTGTQKPRALIHAERHHPLTSPSCPPCLLLATEIPTSSGTK